MQKTQESVLKHHGGDGDKARQMITQSYARRHDDSFWQIWHQTMDAAITKESTLVDIGAGIGQFINDLALQYPDSKVLGLEVAEYMFQAKMPLPKNANLLLDDIMQSQAPIENGTVSAMMANMVLHEMNQPVTFLRQVARWLKVGGRIMVIDLVRQPLQEYLEYKYPENEIWNLQQTVDINQVEDVFEHFAEHNRYQKEDVDYLFSMAGFKVVYSESKGRMHHWVFEKV